MSEPRTEPVYVMVPSDVIKRGPNAERRWLKRNGYDGLACVVYGAECGCHVDDFQPCCERGDRGMCVAAKASADGDWFEAVEAK